MSGLRWAAGAGAASVLDYDDMFQVASAAFCIAAAGFDPDCGFKFSTYYTKVAFSEMRKEIGIITGVKNLNDDQRAEIVARKDENKERRARALPDLPEINYGLAPVSFGDMKLRYQEHDAVSTDMPYEATLLDEGQTPEEQVMHADLWAREEAKLSPLAQIMVAMLRDPPDQLLQEVAAKRAYADQCTAFGKRAGKALREGMTIAAVRDFLMMVGDVTKRELSLAEGELMRALERIEEAD